MATAERSRTVDTLNLKQFQRQFFQWYYIDCMSFSQITAAFDHLFSGLVGDRDMKIKISEKQWRDRFKKWEVNWDTAKLGQGEPVTMPEHLQRLPLWYEDYQEKAPPLASAQTANPYVTNPNYLDEWDKESTDNNLFTTAPFASTIHSPAYPSHLSTLLPLFDAATSEGYAVTHPAAGNVGGQMQHGNNLIQPSAATSSSKASVHNNEPGVGWLNEFDGGNYSMS
ncbi:MAG: hypothetical protein Q9179_002903 [Wetmoreana sp. 5 TL-2023]